MDDISVLLQQLQAGDSQAQDALFRVAYDELRKLARSRLYKHGRGTCLDTTALVNETYLRFKAGHRLRAEHRKAFFLYASHVMRSVIVDAVRERQAERRGGDLERLTLSTQLGDEVVQAGEQTMLDVHEALDQLAQIESRLAKVVEMRFFGGYSEAEIAAALELSDRQVRRDWRKAVVFLEEMLKD